MIAEGESLNLLVPPTGNTNTLGRFRPDVRTYLKKWIAEAPTHHHAPGVGRPAATLKHVADTLGIETVLDTRE